MIVLIIGLIIGIVGIGFLIQHQVQRIVMGVVMQNITLRILAQKLIKRLDSRVKADGEAQRHQWPYNEIVTEDQQLVTHAKQMLGMEE